MWAVEGLLSLSEGRGGGEGDRDRDFFVEKREAERVGHREACRVEVWEREHELREREEHEQIDTDRQTWTERE